MIEASLLQRLASYISIALTLVALVLLIDVSLATAHDMQFHDPLDQPGSPIRLKSCYLGTNFMFGDGKLASEQQKMQLGVKPDGQIPAGYQRLAFRFRFTEDDGRHSSDVVTFTGTMVLKDGDIMGPPSGNLTSYYLPRVEPYGNYRCGVEFAEGKGDSPWMPDGGYILSFAVSGNTKTAVGDVGINALELSPHSTAAVFVRDGSSEWLLWSLDGAPHQTQHFDTFDRAVVALGKLDPGRHCLRYGITKSALPYELCFHPYLQDR